MSLTLYLDCWALQRPFDDRFQLIHRTHLKMIHLYLDNCQQRNGFKSRLTRNIFGETRLHKPGSNSFRQVMMQSSPVLFLASKSENGPSRHRMFDLPERLQRDANVAVMVF